MGYRELSWRQEGHCDKDLVEPRHAVEVGRGGWRPATSWKLGQQDLLLGGFWYVGERGAKQMWNNPSSSEPLSA
jgi:hypothetical protein